MLKVGLLLDGEQVSAWVKETIDALRLISDVEIVQAVVNQSPKSNTNRVGSIVYRTLRKIDKNLMPVGNDPFRKKKLDLSGIPILKVNPLQTKLSDRFPDDALAEISKANVDILLRFGFRILRGDILNVPKYGVLSLHHGDTSCYRGGPPAFWEVVNHHPVTKVTAQRLTEELDGGIILKEATLRTDKNSFYRNQAKLYWAGMELLLNIVQEMAKDPIQSLQKNIPGKLCYTVPLYRNPGNTKAAMIALKWIMHNAGRKIQSLFYTGQWQLLYAKAPLLPSSLYRYKKLLPPTDRIWADPFVLKKENYFIFFEEKLNRKKEAHISFIELTPQGIPVDKKPSIALQEKHHLSYPFVFSYKGADYMMPESAASKELNLYVSVDFPARWERVKTLLSGRSIYDATLYLCKGIWYIFCNEKVDERFSSDAYLHIYYSADLLNAPFKPHPSNPVYRDVTCSRPAGNLFTYQNMLIRPSQISAPDYGSGIQLNRVIELTPEVFKEEKLESLSPSWEKNIKAMHTINFTDGLSVADIQTKRFRWKL